MAEDRWGMWGEETCTYIQVLAGSKCLLYIATDEESEDAPVDETGAKFCPQDDKRTMTGYSIL